MVQVLTVLPVAERHVAGIRLHYGPALSASVWTDWEGRWGHDTIASWHAMCNAFRGQTFCLYAAVHFFLNGDVG
jgi:hypothetical protein